MWPLKEIKDILRPYIKSAILKEKRIETLGGAFINKRKVS